jgi:hypothetical protein
VQHSMYPMTAMTKSGYLRLTKVVLLNNFLMVKKSIIAL